MRTYYFFSCLLLAYLSLVFLTMHSKDFAVSPHTTREITTRPLTLSDLLEPINPTGDGLEYFLSSVYSHPTYAIDVLPNTFQHMHQLLTCYTPDSQKIPYQQSILRLFSNRLKSCSFVNPSALTGLLESFPKVLVSKKIELDLHKKAQKDIVDLLYQEFLSNFCEFKADPDNFFATLSKKISETVLEKQKTTSQELPVLQTSLLTFLEISLGKLVWSPQDQEKTWENAKTISQHLTALANKKLIANQEKLCDLFITLIERYRLFVELMHESLSVEFFEKTRKDILENSYPLLDMAEQEDFIESRKERLLRSLEMCEARARAREYQVINSRPLYSQEQAALQHEEPSKKIRKKRKRHA